ncbi:butyrophilin-like protein 8, partial [Colossoma macropomum]|uniref:butyrophilin-like protein 8 n=1 Tax=Colossoma macropomum TaxID=42526 RepID=UPI001863E29A
MNTRKSRHYRGRTALFKKELKNGNSSLRLSKVIISDEGEYRCRVVSESWSDNISVKLEVEVIGTRPVISVENYDSSSEEFSLLCESKGWFPEPDLQWLDRKGNNMSAGVTELQRHAELFSVKRRFTVHYSDISKYYCRVTLREHMMEEEITPSTFY